MKKTCLILALIACSFVWFVCLASGVTLLIAYGVFDKQLVAHPDVIGTASGVGAVFTGIASIALWIETVYQFER